jgi:hypothetical protein
MAATAGRASGRPSTATVSPPLILAPYNSPGFAHQLDEPIGACRAQAASGEIEN